MPELTDRQHEVLQFIATSIKDRGYPPTFREIMHHFGFNSPNSAAVHLRALKAKGCIEVEPHSARGIRLLIQEPKGIPLFDMRSIAQAVRTGAW